jgi:hypothetical protein
MLKQSEYHTQELESEWDSMKQNMALFYVYRLIAQRFFYSDNERFSF